MGSRWIPSGSSAARREVGPGGARGAIWVNIGGFGALTPRFHSRTSPVRVLRAKRTFDVVWLFPSGP
jgi:hypothetical protein